MQIVSKDKDASEAIGHLLLEFGPTCEVTMSSGQQEYVTVRLSCLQAEDEQAHISIPFQFSHKAAVPSILQTTFMNIASQSVRSLV